MPQKDEHVHIRASARQKAVLTQAARSRRVSVSQFILEAAVPAAESVVAEEMGHVDTLFRLDPDAWRRFTDLLDAPVRKIPELEAVLLSKAPWEQ